MHVVVLVLGETAAEQDIGTLFGEFGILCVQGIVALIVNGIIGRRSLFPFAGVLVGDYSVRLLPELEMFVFYDAGVWHFGLGVVDYGVALEVFYSFQRLMLEAQRTEVQFAELEVEEFVDAAGIDYLIGQAVEILAVTEIVGIQLEFNTL